MKEMFCLRAADVSYWDGYSIWYQLWFEHNNYHDGVLATLTERVAPVETENSFAYHSVSEAIETGHISTGDILCPVRKGRSDQNSSGSAAISG